MGDGVEVWKDVPEYEGYYQVSNFGRIKSLQKRRGGRYGVITIYREHIMSPSENGNGYKMVFLFKNGERKRFYVHRLVAENFLSKCDGRDVINHKNHDRADNKASNLEWCTQKENTRFSAHLMRGPRFTPPQTNTGIKYISKRNANGHISFRLAMKFAKINKSFKTLDEAVKHRNEVMRIWSGNVGCVGQMEAQIH